MKKILLLFFIFIFFSFGFFSNFTVSAEKDIVSPTIKFADPQNNSSNVDADKIFKIYFSEKIKKGTNFKQIVLEDIIGNDIPAQATINSNCLILTPSASLVNDTRYAIKITKGSIQDLSGNILVKNFSIHFKTKILEEKHDPAATPSAISPSASTSQVPYAILITSSPAISLSNAVTSSDGLKVYIYSGKKYVEANDIQAKYNCFIDFQIVDYSVRIYGTSNIILSGDNKTKPLLVSPLYVGDLNFHEHLYSLFELGYYESTIKPLLESIN